MKMFKDSIYVPLALSCVTDSFQMKKIRNNFFADRNFRKFCVFSLELKVSPCFIFFSFFISYILYHLRLSVSHGSFEWETKRENDESFVSNESFVNSESFSDEENLT